MNRRAFISKSVAFGAFSMLAPSVINSTLGGYQNQKILNIGVIGTGDRGSGLLHVMQDMPEYNPVAICDLIPPRLEKAFQLTNGKAKKFTDYHKLLDLKGLDAVFICTPLSMHYQMAADALKAGRHVYCEKAMAFTIPEIQDLVRQVSASDRVFQTGHQYRSAPFYYKVRDIIREGYLGEITHVDCQWNRNNNWRRPLPDNDPKWEKLVNWRMYREYSGGLVAELLSHQIDFINWAFNSRPARISGFGGNHYYMDGRETFDNVHVLMEYPNNMVANFNSTLANDDDGYLIKIRGSKATVTLTYNEGFIYPQKVKGTESEVVDGVTGATLLLKNEKGGISILSDKEKSQNKDSSWYALKEFHMNILEGKLPESNVYTGAEAAIAVNLANQAMQQHKVFEWKDEYTSTI